VELSAKKVPPEREIESGKKKRSKNKRERGNALSLLFPKSAPTAATKGTTAPSLSLSGVLFRSWLLLLLLLR